MVPHVEFFFVRFLEELKIPKRNLEINRPLSNFKKVGDLFIFSGLHTVSELKNIGH